MNAAGAYLRHSVIGAAIAIPLIYLAVKLVSKIVGLPDGYAASVTWITAIAGACAITIGVLARLLRRN